MESVVLDAAGHRRSPATMPRYHQGRAPRNKGLRYPADPPTIEEIVAAMRAAGDGPDGARLRALLVILWRAGLRISEALDLAESDLDRSRGAVLVRRGKGRQAPRGRDGSLGLGSTAAVARDPRESSRRGFALRHPRSDSWKALGAVSRPQATPTNRSARRCPSPVRPSSAPPRSCSRDGPRGRPLVVIQRQLGHANLGITSIYLQGIDSSEIIDTVHSRPAPVISATAGLIRR
jgi:integrase